MADVDELLDGEPGAGRLRSRTDVEPDKNGGSERRGTEGFHSGQYRSNFSNERSNVRKTCKTSGSRSLAFDRVLAAEGSARRRHDNPRSFLEECMKRTLRFLAAMVLALAAPALAQVQTGSILVKATDEQGAVTPGVTVTITSS